MNAISRTVIVFDARNLEEESAFWVALLGGVVLKEETWHSLIDASGQWKMGFQLNPNHVKPEWPIGDQQQQIHLDLHTDQPQEIHREIISLGGELLQGVESFEGEQGFQVYADPAGHPFCVGWGHPSDVEVLEIYRGIVEG